MSTSGLSTSVTPPPSLCVSTSGSALAPGRRGPMTQAPSTTTVAGDDRRRQGDRQRAAGLAEDGARRLGEPHPQQGGGEEPGGDERQRQRDPVAVGAERGDEHEQHGAGHERLATGVGPEGERVARQHDEGGADRGQQRPAADVLDRRDGDLELVADQRRGRPT